MAASEPDKIFVPYWGDHYSFVKNNYCHYVLKAEMGYLLNPKIPRTGGQIKVIDLGSETAAWAIDVVRDRSLNASVDCVDLTAKAFPPQAWMPDSLKFVVHDATTEFSSAYLEQYDIVNLRWFLTLTDSQIQALLRTAKQLLKPGGYIQWTEHDKNTCRVATSKDNQASEAMQALVDLERKPFPDYDIHWLDRIPERMEEAGFQVVTVDRITSSPSLRSQWNEVHLVALDDVPQGVSGLIDEFRDKYRERLIKESLDGVGTSEDFLCMVARKGA